MATMSSDLQRFFACYSFQNFILGKENKEAQYAAKEVSRFPGRSYNPLFICGGIGLGKTHLLGAIGGTIFTQHPSMKIKYIIFKNFMEDLLKELAMNYKEYFLSKIEDVDVLLLDNLDFSNNIQYIEEILLRLLDDMIMQKKQIVFTSRQYPSNIYPPLQARINSGLIVELLPLTLETRIAYLKYLQKTQHIILPMEIEREIAYIIDTNFRDLEGAFHKVKICRDINSNKLTVEKIEQLLENFIASNLDSSIDISSQLTPSKKNEVVNLDTIKEDDEKDEKNEFNNFLSSITQKVTAIAYEVDEEFERKRNLNEQIREYKKKGYITNELRLLLKKDFTLAEKEMENYKQQVQILEEINTQLNYYNLDESLPLVRQLREKLYNPYLAKEVQNLFKNLQEKIKEGLITALPKWENPEQFWNEIDEKLITSIVDKNSMLETKFEI